MNTYSTKESAMQQLSRTFGTLLELDIIETVAQNCSYKVEEASVMLSEISHGLEQNAGPENPFRVVERRKKKEVKENSPDEIELRYQKELDIQRVVQFIKEGWKVVVLLRGLPGSGKSYLANSILKDSLGQVNRKDFILSTDDYFSRSGVYDFNPAALQTAHSWNQKRCFSGMRRGYSPLLIDNTNLEVWQMKPYCLMAAEFGYCIEVVEPITWWAMNPRVLEERNVHGIHKGKIMELLSRYETNITADVLERLCNLKYHNVLPQYRRYPPLEKTMSQNLDNLEVPNYSWKLQEDPIQDVPMEYVNPMLTKSIDELLALKKGEGIANDCALLNATASFSPKLDSSNSPQKEDCTKNSKSSELEDFIKASSPRIANDTDLLSKVDLQSSSINILQPSALKDSSKTTTDLTAWGLTEKALFSWDLFQPVVEQQPHPSQNIPVQDDQARETSDRCTNTCAADFKMALDKSVQGEEKILLGQNRDITLGIEPAPLSPRKKIVVDQSCMTNQEALLNLSKEENSSTEDVNKLITLFPTIQAELLNEIYEKCQKDINWTVDLLIDNGVGNLSTVTAKKELKQVEKEVPTEDLISFDLNCSPKTESKSTVTDDERFLDALRLKRHIENNVDINKEHYSPYVWELRNIKQNKASPAKQEETVKSPSSSQQRPKITDQTLDEETVYYSDEENEINDRLLEINLGEDLAEHLEGLFGKIDCSLYKPVVQIPESLAKQLHALLIESAARQIDNPSNLYEEMLAQDQAFAIQLQEEERSTVANNLNEIMDNEYANNLYMKDVEKWKNLSPDDLASKLTKQKLIETFPNVNKDTLLEIWQAHGNCYKSTVETLLASTDPKVTAPSNVFEPPISQTTLEEMKMAQEPALGSDEDNDERSAISYREEANYYMRKHKDILQLMQHYRQRGMHEVSAFYSDLARKQIQLAELANQRASFAFIQENGAKLNDSTTLDLHYLFVKEALSSLDIFLDHHISRLAQNNISSEHMYIITGRGKRSETGQSRLKPAVMKRLTKRKIRFHQVNPGLLRINVQKNLLMSTDI